MNVPLLEFYITLEELIFTGLRYKLMYGMPLGILLSVLKPLGTCSSGQLRIDNG